MSETECPFCAEKLEGLSARPLAPLTSRAALVFLGASALAGCGKEPGTGPSPRPWDNGQVTAVPAYGVPPPDLHPVPSSDAAANMIEPPAVMDAGVERVTDPIKDAGADASAKRKAK